MAGRRLDGTVAVGGGAFRNPGGIRTGTVGRLVRTGARGYHAGEKDVRRHRFGGHEDGGAEDRQEGHEEDGQEGREEDGQEDHQEGRQEGREEDRQEGREEERREKGREEDGQEGREEGRREEGREEERHPQGRQEGRAQDHPKGSGAQDGEEGWQEVRPEERAALARSWSGSVKRPDVSGRFAVQAPVLHRTPPGITFMHP